LTATNQPKDFLAEAREKYLCWLAGGAKGRLHLNEPEGVNICQAVNGRGFRRLENTWRRFCLTLANYLPGNAWKIFWYRKAGVTIGKNVFISYGVKFDWLAPWLITLEDGCSIGYEALVVVHLYYQHKLILRKVTIGKEAVVGLRAAAIASLGDRSVLAPGSVLLTDAPAGVTLSGIPAKAPDFVDPSWTENR
jgi:acetyltransferase-like isoleucine patch superfamily enzyme